MRECVGEGERGEKEKRSVGKRGIEEVMRSSVRRRSSSPHLLISAVRSLLPPSSQRAFGGGHVRLMHVAAGGSVQGARRGFEERLDLVMRVLAVEES